MKKVFTVLLAAMVVMGSTFAFAEDVYATKNGKKYHKVDCMLIQKKGAKAIAMDEALQKGLKPCHKCFPETDGKTAAQKAGTVSDSQVAK